MIKPEIDSPQAGTLLGEYFGAPVTNLELIDTGQMSRVFGFDAKRFGQAIRRRRVAAGLSQESLANAAKLHPTYISLLERGLREPKLTSIRKLAVALKVGAGVLVDEADGKRPRR